LIAGIIEFLGSRFLGKLDFKNRKDFGDGNGVKSFFLGLVKVLDFSLGDSVDLMKIRDSVTKDFSNKDTLDSSISSGFDNDGVFIVLKEKVDGVHDVLANAVRSLADSDFVLGASSSFFFGSSNSVVFVKS